MFPILIIYNAGSSVRDDDYSLLLKVKIEQRRYQPLPLLTASHGFILMWGGDILSTQNGNCYDELSCKTNVFNILTKKCMAVTK